MAVPVLPGHFVITSGTNTATRPELAGTVLADTYRNFQFKDGHGGTIAGQIEDKVVRETSAGTLDFYTRVIMSPESSTNASVHQFSRTNFAAYTTDVDYTTDGPGDRGTTIIGRASNGSSLACSLHNSLNPGESSYSVFTRTNAITYDAIGTTVLNYADANSVTLYTYEPRGDARTFYVPTDLGPYADVTGLAYLNDRGQVSFPAPGVSLTSQAAIWNPSAPNALDGAVTLLPTLPNTSFAVAGKINSSGQVTGTCNYANGLSNAFLWTPDVKNGTTGTIVNLGTLPGDTLSVGYGLNDSGEVSGASGGYVNGALGTTSVVWQSGTPFTFPNGAYGGSYAINNSGQAVGFGGFAGTYFGYIWTPSSPNGTSGSTLNLSQEGSIYDLTSAAGDINDAGVTVGDYLASDFSYHGFIWSGSTVTDLGVGNGMFGINNKDQAVGTYNQAAALFYSNDVLSVLDSFLPTGSSWFLLGAFSINNVGQIICQAYPLEAVLLTPVHISTFSPVFHPTTGFNLTLTGTGFEPNALVFWNGVALNNVSATSTKIVAQVTAAEASASGPINVMVINPDGTAWIKLYD
ncbi:MAG TPA: hypothetical protein VKU00_34090 [Chthonomonadaceae bacterium]|nr:hypothetical protein [Chthonomonadaceae bacterium]